MVPLAAVDMLVFILSHRYLERPSDIPDVQKSGNLVEWSDFVSWRSSHGA